MKVCGKSPEAGRAAVKCLWMDSQGSAVPGGQGKVGTAMFLWSIVSFQLGRLLQRFTLCASCTVSSTKRHFTVSHALVISWLILYVCTLKEHLEATESSECSGTSSNVSVLTMSMWQHRYTSCIDCRSVSGCNSMVVVVTYEVSHVVGPGYLRDCLSPTISVPWHIWAICWDFP